MTLERLPLERLSQDGEPNSFSLANAYALRFLVYQALRLAQSQ